MKKFVLVLLLQGLICSNGFSADASKSKAIVGTTLGLQYMDFNDQVVDGHNPRQMYQDRVNP